MFRHPRGPGVGQIILLCCLILYTLFCALPIILVFIAAFTDEKK